ncbi:MAG: hypothetical protein ACXWXT_12165, partial [Candidatus Binatia bacterium]
MSRIAIVCSLAALLVSPLAPAQAANAQAIPDFYANGLTWSHISGPENGYSGKNFDPPPPGAPGARGPIGFHPDHPHIGNGTPGQTPTPRIGNDTNPLLRPWAAEQMKKTREAIVAGGVPFDPAARCWPAGVPAVISFANQATQFLQTRDQVIILYERGQVVRRIHLNQAHTKAPEPTWYGESVGHYENGDTLVVDTIGMTDKSFIDVFNVPHSKALHVIERYRLLDGGKKLELTITVEDPQTFTQVWSAGKMMQPAREPVGEVLCQVNNDDNLNQGL